MNVISPAADRPSLGRSCHGRTVDRQGLGRVQLHRVQSGYGTVGIQNRVSVTDSREALRTLIRDIKAGKADHLL